MRDSLMVNCPFTYGHKRIPLKLQISYCLFLLWAPNCLSTLYYFAIPSLRLLKGISLLPKISSLWILPFAYVISSSCAYSLGEFIWCGGTLLGWWNDQRMWVFKRTTSYFFGFSETILKQLGFSKSSFAVASKVADEEESKKFEKEVMEFGAPSPMFTILATLALLNLFTVVEGIMKVIMDMQAQVIDSLLLQILPCGFLVFMNLPIYQGLFFFRKDAIRMPYSITYQSIPLALLTCVAALY